MLLFGTEESVPPRRLLSAGPLSAEFDRGSVRHVRWSGFEVLRAIGFITRDTHWGTYTPLLSEPEIAEDADGFAVRYHAEFSGEDGTLRYDVEIAGLASGVLTCYACGTSPDGFATNRTGFIVLHPLEGVVGHDVEVLHASGGESVQKFPELIDPKQPVFDVRELRHTPAPGMIVSVRMEGDSFEMEDHRNWTDASFKTYAGPLARPFPYRIAGGETVEQKITLRIEGAAPSKPAISDPVTVSLGGNQGHMPKIGLHLLAADRETETSLARRLAEYRPSFLLARLDARRDLLEATWLADVMSLSERPLWLDVIIPGKAAETELAPVADAVRRLRLEPEAVFVAPARDLRSRAANQTPAGENSPEEILAAAREAFPRSRIGGGMPIAFTELNRNRPPAGIDFVTHATQAIGHDADDTAVIETLEALPHVIRSVRAIVGDIPYRIGLATIGAPEEFFSATPVANPENRRIAMAEEDPRQRGLFAAAFALGYVAAAIGVDAITLAASSGPAGLAAGGCPYPIKAVVEGMAELADLSRIATQVTRGAKVAAVAADAVAGPVLWLANLSGAPVDVRIVGRTFDMLDRMDAGTLAEGAAGQMASTRFAGETIRLDAYAVSCLT